MDPNSNHSTAGMNLSEATGGQAGNTAPFTAAGDGAGGVMRQQVTPITAPTSQVVDEALSDEEIDQVWVNKAKDIVEQTKTDPYAQSNELNKIKAEYLKLRFDKELSINDKTSQ
jgi:hypothetical protein